MLNILFNNLFAYNKVQWDSKTPKCFVGLHITLIYSDGATCLSLRISTSDISLALTFQCYTQTEGWLNYKHSNVHPHIYTPTNMPNWLVCDEVIFTLSFSQFLYKKINSYMYGFVLGHSNLIHWSESPSLFEYHTGLIAVVI